MEKSADQFWIFALDNPALMEFYNANNDNKEFYWVLWIEKVGHTFPEEMLEVLHLRDEVVLLMENYIVPVFLRLALKGYCIVVTDKFCNTDNILAMLKMTFVNHTPEGIIDVGKLNEPQKQCIDAIWNAYNSTAFDDEFNISVLRNLAINFTILSSTINYDVAVSHSSYQLTYALRCLEMIKTYFCVSRRKSFYADKLNITEKMLSQILNNIFHMSFRDLMVNCTIIEAIRMLVFTDLTLTQIAYELNIDISNFSKLFITHKGMHPSELRTAYRKIVDYAQTIY